MKKIIVSLLGIALAVAMTVAPSVDVKAATDGYVLTDQARDLLSKAQYERDDAQRDVDRARDKIDDLRRHGASSSDIDNAYDRLDECRRRLDRKQDKVSKARSVLDFVNSRSQSEIFLASMQEKFRNEASLAPMQDRIQGAKSILSAQLTQINVIQQAIQSQTSLAQTNPAIFAQVQELNNAYQQELAQYNAQQQELAHLEKEYADFAATMPLPTMEDKMKLSEIRYDFQACCREFDEACAE